MERFIEDKIKEYISYGADTDIWGMIPSGCTLTWEDYQLIEDLVSESIMFRNGLLSSKLKDKYIERLQSLHSNLPESQLIELLLSIK